MTIQEKREALARAVIEQYEDSLLYDILMDGCTGYNNMSDADIDREYSDCIGEE